MLLLLLSCYYCSGYVKLLLLFYGGIIVVAMLLFLLLCCNDCCFIVTLLILLLASSYVTDFNTRNKLLTQKLLKQGYWYHILRKTFFKFYRRSFHLISKFQVGLKSLLRQRLSEPEFYDDLVYKLKKIVGSINFQRSSLK